jgi:hypothetical protein
LLLPAALEDFGRGREVRDLLRAPAVVAVEPARLSRVPDWMSELLAAIQARRVVRQVPGMPRVVVVFDDAQHLLAHEIVARCAECELWDGRDEAPGEVPAFRHNAPLWNRLEELGVARR